MLSVSPRIPCVGGTVKNGLLVYSDEFPYFNVGDYIQSLAAKQFFDSIDVQLCRENLHFYAAEDVRVILNGWFMHKPENWPPSDAIHPLFVSFHINSDARDTLTNSASISYLKRHSPIGCRDHNTVELLQQHGVDAYFSGCLTLSLGKSYKRTSDSGRIFFVDAHFKKPQDLVSLLKYSAVLYRKPRVISVIAAKMFGKSDFKSLLKAAAFYSTYTKMFEDDVLVEATYINQVLLNSTVHGEDSKFELADKLLQQYASAKFVVTSRIHCALPCLGIGTPVLYIDNEQQSETSYCRLSGLKELFHVITCSGTELHCDFINEKVNSGFALTNKSDYKVLADNLIRTCADFASNRK